MPSRIVKKPPIVRLPPKSNIELLLQRGSQFAMILVGFVGAVFALGAAKYILAPGSLGIVLGLMLGPIASRIERFGLRPGISALAVIVLLVCIIGLCIMALAAPLSFWLARMPQLWADLQAQLVELKGPIEAIKNIRQQVREVVGSEGVTVSVDDGASVESMVVLAPAVIAQILIFFACLYFFIATRHQTRLAILKLCFNRRLRWRVAHIFRDAEAMVSRYLVSITLINISEGIAVAVGLYLVGIPSAVLWGVLAALLNFIVFIGPAIMVAILFMVGLAEFDTLGGSLLPVIVYLAINLLEAQFVTPIVVGRTMTLNPFIVVLALIFWIWIWGPLGGFVAIPALLLVYAILRNIIPGIEWSIEDDRR